VVDLLKTVEPAVLDRPAPATPAWRVRDVVAHMVGVADDVVSGRLDGIASDPWTAAQVDRRRDMPLAELLGDWDDYGPRFEELLAGAPPVIAGQAVFDAFTHEHDIRNALARPGARDSAALDVSWEWLFAANAEAPAIGFVTEQGEEVMGSGAAATSVGASRFELLRAVTGRRTAAEIAGFEWEPICDPGLIVITPQFTMRTESLNE
jgi:uncharacterized protein (TIGR03083 family)